MEESIIRNTALLMYNPRNGRSYLPQWRSQGGVLGGQNLPCLSETFLTQKFVKKSKPPLSFRKIFDSKKLTKMRKK